MRFIHFLIVLSALLTGLVLLPADATTRDLSGTLSVIDGDTVEIGMTRIRLYGIDAPEHNQRCGGGTTPMWSCGAWVSERVRDTYDGVQAVCVAMDRDRYNRIVARCTVAGRDMGQTLVEDGLAFAFRRYSQDYVSVEKIARDAKRGVHGAGVMLPQNYRARTRRSKRLHAERVEVSSPGACLIKGNISQSGARIFHMPGQEWYDKTRISPEKGERFFCSEKDARLAGWRKARR